MTDYTLNLVDAIISGRATDIETAFQEAITDKISIAMDTRRTEIAQSMFTKESAGAYETWDPKHPKFKDKLIKHHAKGGTTQSFIDQEKAKAWKQLTRESVEEELTLEDYTVEELEEYMLSEDFEQLDELSKATLGSYVKKAGSDRSGAGFRAGMAAGQGKDSPYNYDANKNIAIKREKGISKAVDKLTKEEFTLEDYSLEELEDFMVSEDFEQLDEVSKATLGSYVKKASGKLASHGINMVGSLEKSDIANAAYHGTKIDKRQKGISKAVDKLTK